MFCECEAYNLNILHLDDGICKSCQQHTSSISLILAEYVFSVCTFNIIPGKEIKKEIVGN